jgi:hypothetical protein
MGSEIVYCAACATRLTGADFDRGRARRVGHQVFCEDCAPPEAEAPGPPEAARPPSARLSGSGPRIPRPQDTTRRHAAKPAPPPWPWIAGGAAVGVLVLAVLLSSTSPPPPRAAAPTSPPPAARPAPAPRAETARPSPPPAPAPEVDRLEEAVAALVRQEAYAEALRRCEEASSWRTDEAGMKRVLTLRQRALAAAREKLAAALAEAAAARARRDEPAVGRTRERVVGWGIRELVVEFDRGLPKTPEAPWQPLFDGRTAGSLLGGGSEAAWEVKDGVLERTAGSADAGQSKQQFGDAEFRIRFESLGTDVVRFTVRQGGEGGYTVNFRGREVEGAHELLLSARGAEVAAQLDGRPVNVEVNGRPARGHLQFGHSGGRLRIKAVEGREAGP